jgi:hypothetical protein
MLPNLQKYWDGSGWIAQRRWMSGKWTNEPVSVPGMPATPGAGAGGGAAGGGYPGFASRPTGSAAVRPFSPTSITGSTIGLFVSCIVLIVGSFTPWVTVSAFNQSVSVSGTDSAISDLIGVNGWITFSGAILLFILVCMSAISNERMFRSFELIIALVVTGFALYDLVRIIQKVSAASSHPTFNGTPVNALTANAGVGWGLIVVFIGALGALVCAIGEARKA